MTNIAKLIIRGLLGLVVGIFTGAVICALEFALLAAIGGNRSLGGIGMIENPIQFAAMIGAIAGSFYGAIVGFVNGLAGFQPTTAAAAGLGIGAIFAIFLVFTSSDVGVGSAAFLIFVTGGILGLAIGFVLTLVTKKITRLAK